MSSSNYIMGMTQRLIAAGLAASLTMTGVAGCASRNTDNQAATAQVAASSTKDGISSDTASDSGASSGAAIESSTITASSDGAATSATATGETLLDVDELFADRDLDASYEESEATRISLSDTGSTVKGNGASVAGSVITIAAEGTYVVSGALSDGQLVVDADEDKVQIVLAGVDISNDTSAALYVKQADKVFLTLAEGSSNTLSVTGSFEAIDDNNIDGAVFSKDDLTINGNGALTVSCADGHGIVVKDDLTLVSGTYTVSASGHALQVKGALAVRDGEYTLTAGKDGLHAEDADEYTKAFVYVGGGTLSITAATDGIDSGSVVQLDGGALTIDAGDDGVHAEYDLLINGGSVSVGSSYEGLEGARITINGGELDVQATDDGLNASGDPNDSDLATDENDSDVEEGTGDWSGASEDDEGQQEMGGGPGGMAAPGGMGGPGGMDGGAFGNDTTAKLTINGGLLVVDAQGDGLDSNGELVMSGGTVYVSGPTNNGNGALDFGDGGTATLTGGTLIAVGSSGMAENFTQAENQGVMLVNLETATSGEVVLKDADGQTLASFAPTKQYQSVLVSAPGVEEGGTYTLSCGGQETSITMDSLVYGSGMGGFGMGGMAGGQQFRGNPGSMPEGQGRPGEAGSVSEG